MLKEKIFYFILNNDFTHEDIERKSLKD